MFVAEGQRSTSGRVVRRASSSDSVATTSTPPPDPQCTNGPFTRACWGDDFSIATDFDYSWPNTGKTVSYTLEIANITLAPDGHAREVLAVNGQYPGPTIRANWGDTLEITVKNNLQYNGTSMHWHGIRQWHTNEMDGTNGVTECPLAPGQSRTYTFLCTQFGTTWYHSVSLHKVLTIQHADNFCFSTTRASTLMGYLARLSLMARRRQITTLI